MTNSNEKIYNLQLTESEVDLLINWICFYQGEGQADEADEKLHEKLDNQLCEQQKLFDNPSLI